MAFAKSSSQAPSPLSAGLLQPPAGIRTSWNAAWLAPGPLDIEGAPVDGAELPRAQAERSFPVFPKAMADAARASLAEEDEARKEAELRLATASPAVSRKRASALKATAKRVAKRQAMNLESTQELPLASDADDECVSDTGLDVASGAASEAEPEPEQDGDAPSQAVSPDATDADLDLPCGSSADTTELGAATGGPQVAGGPEQEADAVELDGGAEPSPSGGPEQEAAEPKARGAPPVSGKVTKSFAGTIAPKDPALRAAWTMTNQCWHEWRSQREAPMSKAEYLTSQRDLWRHVRSNLRTEKSNGQLLVGEQNWEAAAYVAAQHWCDVQP